MHLWQRIGPFAVVSLLIVVAILLSALMKPEPKPSYSQSAPLAATKKPFEDCPPLGGECTTVGSLIELTVRADRVTIKEITANRGQCKATTMGDLSRAYKFGERLGVRYVFCNVIEVVVRAITWDN
jgi:hypothetical protein